MEYRCCISFYIIRNIDTMSKPNREPIYFCHIHGDFYDEKEAKEHMKTCKDIIEC